MSDTLTAEQIGERAERAEDFLSRRGYRRCDIAACNCGSWHGGNAEDRLQEIRQMFSAEGIGNGKILTQVVQELIERAEKDEAEVATLLGRLQSTEVALDRAMARSNSWREEAATLQAQMLADQERQRRPGLCEMCEHRDMFGKTSRVPHLCGDCVPSLGKYPGWTPKPIPGDGELTMGDG